METFDITPRPVEKLNINVRPRVKFTLTENGLALGMPGLSAYEVWLSQGNTGTEAEYLLSLQGDDGQSAYEIWLANGNTGTEADFITWLQSGGAVKSVNDKTGEVQLNAADVGAEPAKAADLNYVTNDEKTAIGTIANKVDKNGTDRLITEEEVTTFNGKQNALGYTPENSVNKQNSLTTDGTGNKFPTVDAVNAGLSGKENTGVASALITQLINGATTDYDTLKKLENKIIAINSIIGGSAPDGDNIVNTVAELLAVFSTFPEGSNMVTLLTAKLSTSDVYNALDQLLAGKALDARQGKVLSDLCAGLRTDLTAHNHAGTYEPVIAPTVSTPTDTDAIIAKRGTSWISLTFSAIKTALGSVFASITGSNTFVGVQSILQGLKVAKLYPSADSTTAVQVCKADGVTAVVNVDTSNGRVGVGTVAPAYKVDVRGINQNDGIRVAAGIDIYPVPDPTIPTGIVSAGGGVDTGAHWYAVTFFTATGETHATYTSAQIVTTDGNNTVTLNLPLSADDRVIGRKIFRTKKGGANYQEYLLATINNNTAATYVDIAPDSSLTGSVLLAYQRLNTTTYNITIGGVKAMTIDSRGTFFGFQAGASVTTAGGNTFFGNRCGVATNSIYNSMFGDSAGASNTTGPYNSFFGWNCGMANTSGGDNTYMGLYTASGNSVGSQNACFGSWAGRFIADGTTVCQSFSRCVYLGSYIKASANNADNEIVIGYNAIGNGSNTVTIGNTSITKTILRGNILINTTTDNAIDKLQVSGSAYASGQISSANKSALNENGGIMVRLTNKTGAASVKGTVVYASPTTDNAFSANPVDGDMPFGIVYEAGIADGAPCWVVVSGIAEVLMENNTAATRSYIAYSSAVTAGRIQLSASAPSAITHFKEIGHTLESKAAGTNVLVKCILHFN